MKQFDVLRRSSVSNDYVIPDVWHRLAIVDDEHEEGFDPWFNFIQELALRWKPELEDIDK